MPGADGFKHISVTADEDEDVVIQAGVRKPREGEPAETPLPEQTAAAEQPRDAAPSPKAKPAAAPKRKRDEYRETTLEDLKPEPMSLMQKAIIVIAVAAIVGAVVYYFAFMH